MLQFKIKGGNTKFFFLRTMKKWQKYWIYEKYFFHIWWAFSYYNIVMFDSIYRTLSFYTLTNVWVLKHCLHWRTWCFKNGELFIKQSRSIRTPIIKMANFFRVIKMANFFMKMSNFVYEIGEFLSALILKMANFSFKSLNDY